MSKVPDRRSPQSHLLCGFSTEGHRRTETSRSGSKLESSGGRRTEEAESLGGHHVTTIRISIPSRLCVCKVQCRFEDRTPANTCTLLVHLLGTLALSGFVRDCSLAVRHASPSHEAGECSPADPRLSLTRALPSLQISFSLPLTVRQTASLVWVTV